MLFTSKYNNLSLIAKKASTIILPIALIAGTMTGCAGKSSKNNESNEDFTLEVEAATPSYGSLTTQGEFVGTIEADSKVLVFPKVAGMVTETFFEVGDHVEKGDILLAVDDRAMQIGLAQAQAAYDSVKANIPTAEANVELNQINMLYTQAQINETLGTVDTHRMQLSNAVTSAKYGLYSAQNNTGLSLEQFQLARDNYDDLEDNIDDLRDNAKNMEKYAESLKEIRTAYSEIVEEANGDADRAVELLEERGIDVDPEEVDTSSAQKVCNYFIYVNTGGTANDDYSLGVMVNSAENGASQMRSSRASLDSSKKSVRISQISAAMAAQIAKNTEVTAEQAMELANKLLSDYDNYTLATILIGTDYSKAGANAQSIIAKAGLESAQAGLRGAEAALRTAQLQVKLTRLMSPASGTIVDKGTSVNNMISTNQPVYIIESEGDTIVNFMVSEEVVDYIQLGDIIKLERNGTEYNAIVTENPRIADAISGLFSVKALVQESAGKLKTDTTVKVYLTTKVSENVMVIPVDSVYYENHSAYVYVAEGGKAVRKPVETGISNEEVIEIVSGLEPDEAVITTWSSNMTNGSDVSVINTIETPVPVIDQKSVQGDIPDTRIDDVDPNIADLSDIDKYIDKVGDEPNVGLSKSVGTEDITAPLVPDKNAPAPEAQAASAPEAQAAPAPEAQAAPAPEAQAAPAPEAQAALAPEAQAAPAPEAQPATSAIPSAVGAGAVIQ